MLSCYKFIFLLIFFPFIIGYHITVLLFVLLIYLFQFSGDIRTLLASDNLKLYKNKVIWITGASSGIGKTLALQLTNLDAYLIISSRRENVLKEFKDKQLITLSTDPSKIAILPLDLSEFSNLETKGKEALAFFGHVDILINNGGVSTRAVCVNSGFEDVDVKIMKINHLGAVALTKSILPHMIQRKKGAFINISSTAGKIGFGFRSAYCASKWAMLGFFESLRVETSFLNIKVMNVCPGFIRTNVAKNSLNAQGNIEGKEDPDIANGIPPLRFTTMMLNAFGDGIEECWIAEGKTLCLMYLYSFTPTLCRKLLSSQFVSNSKKTLGKKRFNIMCQRK